MTDSDKQQKHFLSHVDRWKDIYQLLGVVTALAISAFAIWQSSSALRIQKEEFHLRNRPLVVIGSHEFSGPAGDSTGKAFSRSVKTHLVNISDIPATQVQGTFEVKLNGKIIGTPCLAPIAVAKDTTQTLALGLTEDMYSAATNPSNSFETTTYLTYSGMLGEKPDQYMTRVTVYWSAQDRHFISRKACYK